MMMVHTGSAMQHVHRMLGLGQGTVRRHNASLRESRLEDQRKNHQARNDTHHFYYDSVELDAVIAIRLRKTIASTWHAR